MKRDQLLILIAIWEFLTAAPLFIGIVAISVFAYPAVISNGGVGGIFGVSVAMLALLPFFCLAVGAGVGLLLRQEWGRVLAIIHSALSLLFIPIGTIVGTLSIVFLVTSGTRKRFGSSRE